MKQLTKLNINSRACGINRIARKDATLSCPLGYQHFEEGAKLLNSDKNSKLITTFQWLSREKTGGFLVWASQQLK